MRTMARQVDEWGVDWTHHHPPGTTCRTCRLHPSPMMTYRTCRLPCAATNRSGKTYRTRSVHRPPGTTYRTHCPRNAATNRSGRHTGLSVSHVPPQGVQTSGTWTGALHQTRRSSSNASWTADRQADGKLIAIRHGRSRTDDRLNQLLAAF